MPPVPPIPDDYEAAPGADDGTEVPTVDDELESLADAYLERE
jgi:hypothetical protein